ncbi:hypothetical protein [Granulicella mallensis]|uniref:Uncharacterized protein n=1 Tax=Granulicella mallensis TaxID=940614 RepID=A0A7W8EAU5_9BACT|nr:hypothetical protein [Granulicella mallensis]MBB5063860.1 hypothetical protein [Granulicella mallensis]
MKKYVAFSPLLPETLSLGLSVSWNPKNQGVSLRDFLTLLRESRKRIQNSGGS